MLSFFGIMICVLSLLLVRTVCFVVRPKFDNLPGIRRNRVLSHRLLSSSRLYETSSFAQSLETGGNQKDGIGVGIDLGTTNSAIAYLDDNNHPRIIDIPNNGRTIKSIVAFNVDEAGVDYTEADNEENKMKNLFANALVGADALMWEQSHNQTAYRHVKRIMGTSLEFLSHDIMEVVPHLVRTKENSDNNNNEYQSRKTKRYKKNKTPSLERIVQAAYDDPTMLYPLSCDIKNPDSNISLVSPETVSSCILHKLLEVAKVHTGRSITRAVIGVPAYFNDAQREATIRAANSCGIEIVKLLREPEAAALAYGVGREDEDEELVLVFDLGGGTYDVSILLVEKGLIEIICTAGNSQLGGTNFDAKISKYLSKILVKDDARWSVESTEMMLRFAETIRIHLSNNRVVEFALPATESGWLELQDPKQLILPKNSLQSMGSKDRNTTHVFTQLSRRDMERICEEEFQQLLRPIREVAIMAGALLSGDARPGAAESAIEIAKVYTENFYDDDVVTEEDDNSNVEDLNSDIQVALQDAKLQIDLRSTKQIQQKGRKKAREMAKQEKKYRHESRRVKEEQPESNVRIDGITGRPLSRIVLVGGATRMPTVGRIIASLTGIVPQRTVDPDEAVALGCAVHVGVLDGKEEMGVVLSPMQAALLRAVVEKERRDSRLDDVDDDNDNDIFLEADEDADDLDFANIEYL